MREWSEFNVRVAADGETISLVWADDGSAVRAGVMALGRRLDLTVEGHEEGVYRWRVDEDGNGYFLKEGE